MRWPRVPSCDDYDHPVLKACTHGAAAVIQILILVYQVRNLMRHVGHIRWASKWW